MNPTDKINAQFSSVFRDFEDPTHIDSVIDHALEYRDKANEGTRSRLNAAIRNSGVNLPGFRDSSKAPSHQLRSLLILDMMKGNDRLAGAVLIAWMESREALKEVIAGHLAHRGIPTGGIDARKGSFDSLWSRGEWENERATLRKSHDDFEVDDIALMLCCVSGRLPEPLISDDQKIESELFKDWIEDLKKLDSDADDWLDLDLFKTALSQLGESKAIERVKAQSEAIEGELAEIVDEYSDELRYLDIEIGAWAGDGTRHGKSTFTEAREFISRLKDDLDEYRPIRPQASTREQEAERVVIRAEREREILGVAERWGEFIARLGDAENDDSARSEDSSPDGASIESAAPADEYENLKAENQALKLEVEQLSTESAERRSVGGASARERQALERDVESLTAENRRLNVANEGLESDKRELGERISKLRGRLSKSRRMEEVWRRSYEKERTKQTQISELDTSELESVTDALELAERTFPDQLLLALNSKSDKNSPFRKPDEVFAALKWLATEYHSLKANPGGSPDFNMLLKQSCSGWSYKSGQTEVTTQQYSEWYTTQHDGKTYELLSHLAKGTSHDPQNTMRIAFEWDDDLGKVVVGFLGLHQRNRRSA